MYFKIDRAMLHVLTHTATGRPVTLTMPSAKCLCCYEKMDADDIRPCPCCEVSPVCPDCWNGGYGECLDCREEHDRLLSEAYDEMESQERCVARSRLIAAEMLASVKKKV